MNKAVIVGVVAVIVVIGGGALLFRNKSNNNAGNAAQQLSPTSQSQSAAGTITYSNGGFSPSTLTVKSGDTVAIKNTSSGTLQLDSDPHPVHTDDEDLNVGSVGAGQTKTFTVTKKGTFGYHNHLNPSDKGSITVQ